MRVEVVEDVLALGLSWPHHQVAIVGSSRWRAEQRLAEARHEGGEGAGFEDARADGVDHRDRALAQRLGHAGGADAAVVAQFQRIGEGGVHAAPEDADRLQAGDGAHHDLAVLDDEVFAFEQHEAEVAGDIGVLEIGLVVLAGRQDADAAVVAPGLAIEGVAEIAEEAGEAMHMHLGVDVGEGARGGDAVLEREAGARGGLGAVAEHPPAAIGAAAEFEGAEMEVSGRWPA